MRTSLSYTFLAFMVLAVVNTAIARLSGEAMNIVQTLVGADAYPYVVGGFFGAVIMGGLAHLAWVYDLRNEERFRAMADDLTEATTMLAKNLQTQAGQDTIEWDRDTRIRATIVLSRLSGAGIKAPQMYHLRDRETKDSIRLLKLYFEMMGEFAKRGMLHDAMSFAKQKRQAFDLLPNPTSPA